MKDNEIDDILKRAGRAPHEVDPALLDRVTGSIGSSLTPIRPLPPARMLTAGLLFLCVGIPLLGAAVLGFHGIEKMSALQRAMIFPTLGMLIWLAGAESIQQMTPGSRRLAAPGFLLAAASLALIAVFAGLFHDYATDRFVRQGVVCLTAGLSFAAPAGLASWLLLRRGYAVNPLAAGMAAGTLAGLAGATLLELHCPNFEAPHVMLWHTAVVTIGGAVGALLGRVRTAKL